MTPLKMILAMLVAVAITVFIMSLLFLPSKERLQKVEENIARQYAISLDSVVRYYKGKDSITHAVTEGNYVTPAQLEMINKQLFEEIKTVVGGNMKNFVSNLKVRVEYPTQTQSGAIIKDSVSGRIDFKPYIDSCERIDAWLDSNKVGHIKPTRRPQEYEFNAFWKRGRLFRPDTLLVDGKSLTGCGEITKQKLVQKKPEEKRFIVKKGTLLGVGVAVGIILTKILLP